jgi:Glycosyl transferases group 1
VISHPDLVSVYEVRDFDMVLAASAPWAREMSQRAGRPVHVLHQATDPRLFAPRAVPDSGEPVLFVGGARRHGARPIVTDALAAGLDLALYGPFWQGLVPDSVIRADYLSYEQLSDAYGAAGVVLNDHWADMREQGFVNNRLFDAVASGARVVSDHIDGLDELFHGAVRTYSSVDELAKLCSPEGRSEFPDAQQRVDIADRVRREHSFAARAEQLTQLVYEALRSRTVG